MYPLLSEKYNFPGPSNVMWGVEIEIMNSLKSLISPDNDINNDLYMDDFNKTIKRIKEMIYKEERILFPLCGRNFTEDEWMAIARDIPEFGYFELDQVQIWERAFHVEDAKSYVTIDGNISDGDKIGINLPGGDMTLTQLRAVLNTLPMEITIIDDQDINRFFNEGEKFFKRPKMAVGRKVYSCHPKHVEPMVRMLIHDFKSGKKDSMSIWSERKVSRF